MPGCGREVVAARGLGPDGALVWECSHCAGPLDARSPQARWVGPAALEQLGYFVDGHEPEAPHGGSGCRGGRCGVAQPEVEPPG